MAVECLVILAETVVIVNSTLVLCKVSNNLDLGYSYAM